MQLMGSFGGWTAVELEAVLRWFSVQEGRFQLGVCKQGNGGKVE